MNFESNKGKILTVNGLIDPEDLGFTLPHEHFYVDLRKNHPLPNDFTKEELDYCNAKLDLSNLAYARAGYPLQDNYVLSPKEEDLIIQEVFEFKKRGGKSLVDPTSIGLGRNPLAIKKISDFTGLNIVLGCSWYQKVFHPENLDQKNIEELTDQILNEINCGIDNTGIKPGIIGEIGVNAKPLIENEIKVIKASAIASKVSGLSMLFHGPPYEEHNTVLDMVEDQGVDPSRVIFGHCDRLAEDIPKLISTLNRGVYVEFDCLGNDGSAKPWDMATIIVAKAIPELIDAGYVNRILISQDICKKVHLKKFGGTGYSFILEEFIPFLQNIGISNSDIIQITENNPKDLLTII